MVRIIIGFIVLVIAVMIAWAIATTLFHLFLWAALFIILGYGLFKVGRWSGSRRSRES